jgi:hypothetical protein
MPIIITQDCNAPPPEFDGEPEPPLPSLAHMAGSLARTAAAVVAGVVRGEAVTLPQDAQDVRWRVCEHGEGLSDDQTRDGHCDHYRPSDRRCGGAGGCGCALGRKVVLAAARCPLDRWPA